jgi:aspartate carbamoyltransferase catalytic subunit
MRHVGSGAAKFIAERLECSVVNAGDGWHAHPTQALLDCFTLYRLWGEDFAGKKILIVGDCAHSRVFRSDVELFTKLGASVRMCAPRTLMPAGVENWPMPIEIFHDLDEAVKGVDVVISLRLQLERMASGLLPSMTEYSSRYCMTPARLAAAGPNVKVMHPGPIQRGTDVSAQVADDPASLILDQVEAGVAVRMAILFLLATRSDDARADAQAE